jgi:hypothetical protein
MLLGIRTFNIPLFASCCLLQVFSFVVGKKKIHEYGYSLLKESTFNYQTACKVTAIVLIVYYHNLYLTTDKYVLSLVANIMKLVLSEFNESFFAKLFFQPGEVI